MDWKREWKWLALILGLFLMCFYLPVGVSRFEHAVIESLALVKWYAREHVLLCLVPAFFIAGAVGVFVSQASVMKYLGAGANKVLAYGVASVSGAILAVCSCTILPLFAGIYRMGAGLGPACAFLYSGPAINILAIILTARVLGLQLGVARAVGAVLFSIVIGLLMQLIFRKEKEEQQRAQVVMPESENGRSLLVTAIYFAMMVGVLVFANWGKPQAASDNIWITIYAWKWRLTSFFAIGLGFVLVRWLGAVWWKVVAVGVCVVSMAVGFPENPHVAFIAGFLGISVITASQKGEMQSWFSASWTFAKQILPLLLFGVLAAGFLLGRPDGEGVIPPEWIQKAVGGNSIGANLFASVAGAFMYFATLTEIPILQGLIGAGMGKGPALALLLAGPALSLPNMLVIRSVLGTKKTVVFVALVMAMASVSGILFGFVCGD